MFAKYNIWFLYTAQVIFSVVLCNFLFIIFRMYYASIPLYQNLLTIVLFSHLSLISQGANIVHAIMLLTNVVFILDNSLFSCGILQIRRFQQNMTVFSLLSLSVSFFISHFKSEIYFKMQNPRFSGFSMFLLILASLSVLSILTLHCNDNGFYELDDECFRKNSFQFLLTLLSIIVLLNTMIILDIFLSGHSQNILKQFKVLVIIPFHGPPQEDPIELRIQTISQNVEEVLSPPVTPHNQEHFTLNTGLLTIILMTVVSAAIKKSVSTYLI
jgi:hypothetical protein